MDISLPSGASVSVKDNLLPRDRFAVQDAVELVVQDGVSVIRGAASAQWKAYLGQVITGWSFPVPVPSVAGLQVLDEYPDNEDDDYALRDALTPRYEKIIGRRGAPNQSRPPSSASATSSA